MRLYKLRVMYPSSNKYQDETFYETEITAFRVDIEEGSLIFYKSSYESDDCIMAVYPCNLTIITSVEQIKEASDE